MRGYILDHLKLRPVTGDVHDPAQGVPEEEIPPGNRYSCPFCSKLVVMSEAKRMSFHLAPLCSGWDNLCKIMGARPAGSWMSG
jgi:hypothetical protein